MKVFLEAQADLKSVWSRGGCSYETS